MPINNTIDELLANTEWDEAGSPEFGRLSDVFSALLYDVEGGHRQLRIIATQLAQLSAVINSGPVENKQLYYVTFFDRPYQTNLISTKYGYYTSRGRSVKVMGERAPVGADHNSKGYFEDQLHALDWRVRSLTQFLNENRNNNSILRDYGKQLESAVADLKAFTDEPSHENEILEKLRSISNEWGTRIVTGATTGNAYNFGTVYGGGPVRVRENYVNNTLTQYDEPIDPNF